MWVKVQGDFICLSLVKLVLNTQWKHIKTIKIIDCGRKVTSAKPSLDLWCWRTRVSHLTKCFIYFIYTLIHYLINKCVNKCVLFYALIHNSGCFWVEQTDFKDFKTLLMNVWAPKTCFTCWPCFYKQPHFGKEKKKKKHVSLWDSRNRQRNEDRGRVPNVLRPTRRSKMHRGPEAPTLSLLKTYIVKIHYAAESS